MGRTKDLVISLNEFPPSHVSRIQKPTYPFYEPCSFKCQSGDPSCGCWNDFGMEQHYSHPRFLDHAEGKFPPTEATLLK